MAGRIITGLALALLFHVTIAITVVSGLFQGAERLMQGRWLSAPGWFGSSLGVMAGIVALALWAAPAIESPPTARVPERPVSRWWSHADARSSRTDGSSGAGSGGCSQSATTPNRRPAIQSSRACTISSCERATKFHHMTSGSLERHAAEQEQPGRPGPLDRQRGGRGPR